ncbi:alcohol oxidase [Lentinus tigrinus ALCF2SS1-7]|uniref:Alcohol oxidase n=1 Tax=Lentinus tigrinus ALCF2SS1-6 TaxID=1328759 RepID=A0A5C2RV59_9APHY|nr:alcohol oxidase [Lentinus tigrinus ALCF2SS1-6]RPD70662.1 alcohol oxidase [Lentinus tigrinus ALCF2SS1-7]
MRPAGRLTTVTCVILGITAATSRAALLTSPAQLSSSKKYDYIVVGAGPGGSPVASRLSEDPKVNVLLIEAGPSDQGVLDIQNPFLAGGLQGSPFDWNYTTTAQKGLNGHTVAYARGHVLGGSSSINLMVWTRGSRDDFNTYASVSGDSGWSWNSIQKYFLKAERFVPPTDGHDVTGQINLKIHGTNGPVNLTVANAVLPTDSHVIATTQELAEFPFNVDSNSGDPLGVGWILGAYGNGVRSSASSSYIDPFLSRKNLDVLVETTATKLVQTGTTKGLPAFRAVEVQQSSTSKNYTLHATKEIILSAGTINTPKILLLSGIGPASQLRSLGIKPLVDNSNVGQNLVDHPRLSNQFGVLNVSDDVTDTVLRNTTLFNELLGEWMNTNPHQGVFASSGANQIGWLRIPDSDPIWKTVKDPSSGPTSPHIEFLFSPGNVPNPGEVALPDTGNFFTISTVVVSPSSRGSVTLASKDPFVSPIIDPNFLNTTFDAYALNYAARASGRFVSAPNWKGFVTGQAGPFAEVDLTSDESINTWVREKTSTIWHPVGTARMGTCKDKKSVVGPDLRVKGVDGVRIVDASVLPNVPAAHPQAAVYVFSERAADLIKKGSCVC